MSEIIQKHFYSWLNESFVQYLRSGCYNDDDNGPARKEDPHNFHLWKEDARLRCLIYKVFTKWSILRNIMFCRVVTREEGWTITGYSISKPDICTIWNINHVWNLLLIEEQDDIKVIPRKYQQHFKKYFL